MLLKMYTYWQECKNITFLKVLIVLVVTVFFFVLVRVTLYPRLEFTGNPNWTNRESFAVKQIIMSELSPFKEEVAKFVGNMICYLSHLLFAIFFDIS